MFWWWWDWRNKQASVQLGSTTPSPSIRRRNVFLTASITCGTGEGPGSTVPSLLARARTLVAPFNCAEAPWDLGANECPRTCNSHLPRGARKRQQLLHPFPFSAHPSVNHHSRSWNECSCRAMVLWRPSTKSWDLACYRIYPITNTP